MTQQNLAQSQTTDTDIRYRNLRIPKRFSLARLPLAVVSIISSLVTLDGQIDPRKRSRSTRGGLANLLLILIASLSPSFAQTAAAPSPQPVMTFLDQSGHPIAGAKLCSFQAGSSTPLATYSDALATIPNANPVIADSAGRVIVFLQQTGYKLTLMVGGDGTCSTGMVIWSVDNIWSIFKQVDTINGLIGNVVLVGTANQVGISTIGNNLVFTLPQAIATTSNVTFNNITGRSLLLSNGPINIGGISVVDTSRNGNFNALSINSNGIVDSARNATLHAVSIIGVGTPAIDNVANFAGHSLTIDGSLAIDNAKNAALHNLSISGTCVGCPAGPVTTQSIGGHVLGTIYQNTGTTPLFVNVDVNLSTSTTLNAYCDALPIPSTIVGGAGTSGTVVVRQTISFIVLPNYFYKVATTSGTATLANWTQWTN